MYHYSIPFINIFIIKPYHNFIPYHIIAYYNISLHYHKLKPYYFKLQ